MNISYVILYPEQKEEIAFLKELGYDGVELAIADPRNIKVEEKMKVCAIGTGLSYTKYGLSLTDFDPTIRKKAIERTKEYIELGASLGAKIIIGLIRGKVMDALEKHIDLFISSLKEISKYAQKEEVEILLEPINRYETFINKAEEMIEIINKVGYGELLLDTFHMNIEEKDPVRTIETYGKYIGHIHIADSNREAPGRGHIDFKAIIKALARVGYNGFLSAEILPVPSLRRAEGETISYLKNILREIE